MLQDIHFKIVVQNGVNSLNKHKIYIHVIFSHTLSLPDIFVEFCNSPLSWLKCNFSRWDTYETQLYYQFDVSNDIYEY